MKKAAYRGKNRMPGFTLIELIVAVVTMGIIMIPLSLMIGEFVRANAFSDTQTLAIGLANHRMGLINTRPWSYYVLNTVSRFDYPNYQGYNLDLIVSTGKHFGQTTIGGIPYYVYPLELGVFPAGTAALTTVPWNKAYLKFAAALWTRYPFGKGGAKPLRTDGEYFYTEPLGIQVRLPGRFFQPTDSGTGGVISGVSGYSYTYSSGNVGNYDYANYIRFNNTGPRSITIRGIRFRSMVMPANNPYQNLYIRSITIRGVEYLPPSYVGFNIGNQGSYVTERVVPFSSNVTLPVNTSWTGTDGEKITLQIDSHNAQKRYWIDTRYDMADGSQTGWWNVYVWEWPL